ncbi:IPT/TIG domain-containing protein [Aureibaculum sp. A20]|uniref:IPT/TIG domain-containing protein n=1 Tax=Aureibaculum flavum TaxID=2795986 RepID=A0ABS0WMM9_9FLAO|nr:IPT/TIG domain-containing protein [Aureibaculum flavum]MBJ2173216.1 IPT/TIG domain-containing protein [Aureibaculum flavum]
MIKQKYQLKIYRQLSYLLVIVFLLGFLTSCNKDDEPRPATLSGISPESGSKNTIVTINGSNFGNNLDNLKVYFNDVQAVVQSVIDTKIQTEVPTLALTGLVKVIVDGTELTGPEFTYEFSEAHVTTLAGNKEGGDAPLDGQGTNAIFGAMDGIALDKEDNLIITQTWKHSIRKITQDGLVTTLSKSEDGGLVEGSINEAKFSWPRDVTVDANGNVYIADSNNNRIRKISPEGDVSTLAGGGQGYIDGAVNEARFFLPNAITIDQLGNIYIAEYNSVLNHSLIRKITKEGMVSTFAGGNPGFSDGQGTDAKFGRIYGLTVDNSGNIIISDAGNNKIRKVSPIGLVTTIAGSTEGYEDGKGEEAKFNFPYGITVDKLDNIYVSDYSNMRIRKIAPDGTVSTLAGKGSYGFDDGESIDATIAFPRAITVDDDLNLYFTQNFLVRKITQE